MRSNNIDSVVNFLVERSGFMEGNEWLLDMAREGFTAVINSSVVDDPKDKLDENNNYIPNKYDCLFFNATFADTRDREHLYTTQDIVEEEEVIYCEESFDALEFSKIEQSMGIALAHVASSIRDIYDERISEGPATISSFSLDNIESRLGGLADYDFIITPSSSRKDEVPSVKVHRSIVNTILDSVVENTDTILIIGGDGGSGSKRKRGYAIDCLYFSEKTLNTASDNRANMGGRGCDYLYHPHFFDSIPIDKYKVVMFNYCARSDVLNVIVNKYKNTDVIVFGLVCEPQTDIGEKIERYESDLALKKYVTELRAGVKVYKKTSCYNIVGMSPGLVAVYVDHGVFIDDRWTNKNDFHSFNRLDLMKKMNLNGYYEGIHHGAIKVLKNRNSKFIDSFLFRLREEDYDSFIDSTCTYVVDGHRIFDAEGNLYLNYTDLPDTKLSGYREKKTGKVRFYDVDMKGSYWFRRYVLSQSNIGLDIGDGIVVEVNREFGSIPFFKDINPKNFFKLAKRCKMGFIKEEGDSLLGVSIEHQDISIDKQNELNQEDYTMPLLFMKGFYFNPLLNRWVYDDDYAIPYIVVNSETPQDGGADFIMSENPGSGRDLGILSPIQIGDNLSIKYADKKRKGDNYIRLYNYMSTKMPYTSFFIDRVKEEELMVSLYDDTCFKDDTVFGDIVDPSYDSFIT